MRKLFSLVIIIVTFYSCTEKNKSNQSLTEFQEYVQSIPLLEEGYSITCSTKFETISTKSTFLPDGASLIGRLIEIDTIHSFIIYSYPADIRLPILEVYNSNGIKINEVTLLDLRLCSSLFPLGESQFTVDSESTFTLQEIKIENRSIVRSTTISKKDLSN